MSACPYKFALHLLERSNPLTGGGNEERGWCLGLQFLLPFLAWNCGNLKNYLSSKPLFLHLLYDNNTGY